MIAALRTHKHRIAFAIALSALAHALLLWGPRIELPSFEKSLPPLLAHLEPLPNFALPHTPKQKPKPQSAPLLGKTKLSSASAVTSSGPATASAVVEATNIEPITAATVTPPISTQAQTPTPLAEKRPPLPRRARLTFSVRSGDNGFEVGEIQHSLSIKEGRYIVYATTRTTGLASWFKNFSLIQSSTGTVNEQGLRPEIFTEEKSNSGSVETLIAEFDWGSNFVRFSSGVNSPLMVDAQDSLSILYQLSRLPLGDKLLPAHLSNGRKLENYNLEVVIDEKIPTPIGDLHTVHLRKQRQPDESGLDIWISMEHRLLPVKVQYTEPDGTIAATITITDIRVSDE